MLKLILKTLSKYTDVVKETPIIGMSTLRTENRKPYKNSSTTKSIENLLKINSVAPPMYLKNISNTFNNLFLKNGEGK